MRPICYNCRGTMNVAQNGIEYHFCNNKGVYVHSRSGDLYECGICHKRIVSDFGKKYKYINEPTELVRL